MQRIILSKTQVFLSHNALKSLKKIPLPVKHAVLKKIDQLSEGFFVSDVKKLVGTENCYRIRVGEYRILYTKTGAKAITVLRIAHRKEVYKA